MLAPELVWEDRLMMFQGGGIKGVPIGPGNPHQFALPLLTTTQQHYSQCLLSLSSSLPTVRTPSSSGRAHLPVRPLSLPGGSVTLLLVRSSPGWTTPTPTGPACKGIPQTRRPQRRAPINNNSTRKDITIWNHQKHTHRCDSEDIAFGLFIDSN